MRVNCQDIEARLTPFVDGELSAVDAAPIAAHLEICAPCRRTAELEQLGRRVIQVHSAQLAPYAPPSLRAAVRRAAPPPSRPRLAFVFAGAAATIVVAAGLFIVASVLRPVPVFAAQAALDHLKCFRLGPQAASSDVHLLESSWRTWQGWDLHIPTGEKGAGLRLMGYRRCIISEGGMAHLQYARGGDIVSLFVMPAGPTVAGHAALEMFGQDAVLWTSHGLTYALVGRGGRAALTVAAASLEREIEQRSVPVSAGY